MRHAFRELWCDEVGFLISAELVTVATITVLGVIVGLTCVTSAVNAELRDLSWALQSLNQSYFVAPFRGCWKWTGPTSWVAGSSFYDTPNDGYGVGGGMGLSTEIGYGVGTSGRMGGGMQIQQFSSSAPCPIEMTCPTTDGQKAGDCPVTTPVPAMPTIPPCDACEIPGQ